ncbi:MAG: MucR family transcriptional regulator [Sphingomonas sp.]|jgi:predicted transcriptional regulator|uniref:MucR family transcriptional regulator n=1 Tax=Sphingomonas sp. TaxID=28214 RepID=UPI003566F04C
MATNDTLLELTGTITSNFVANNHVGIDEIKNVISMIHATLASLGNEAPPAEEMFVPAVTARKSLADPTKIISMIDGKPYSVLKRHLTTQGLTPAEYRARYNLPADYPMTAPAYSERRKAMAVKIGLGRKSTGRPKLGLATPK